MKKRLMIALLVCIALLSNVWAPAQTGKLPPFRMQQANGKVFKAEDLPIGKPIVLIYFLPDCDHCNKLMKELLSNTSVLQKASVAMVTYLPVQEVAKFNALYKLHQYGYIYTGTEGTTYFLKNYFSLNNMPFLALYAKNGDLLKTYPNETGLPDLLSRLKSLN